MCLDCPYRALQVLTSSAHDGNDCSTQGEGDTHGLSVPDSSVHDGDVCTVQGEGHTNDMSSHHVAQAVQRERLVASLRPLGLVGVVDNSSLISMSQLRPIPLAPSSSMDYGVARIDACGRVRDAHGCNVSPTILLSLALTARVARRCNRGHRSWVRPSLIPRRTPRGA